MRYIKIPYPPGLPARWSVSYCARVAELHSLTTQEERSTYLKKHPSWRLLKGWLERLSGNKCWYCEHKSLRAPFDVDHFRPKLEIKVDKVKLVGHTGYYWLAYEWQNFRLSCQRCNRPEEDESGVVCGKANEFPVQCETTRCYSSVDAHNSEVPRLLDPCREADCDLLLHAIDGEVRPSAAVGTWEYQRARYTIDLLGFNSTAVAEEKRMRWQTLSILIEEIGHTSNSRVSNLVLKYLKAEHEYSSFFRASIRTHRDKAWVDAIL